MARVSLPKFGEIEGGPLFVLAVLGAFLIAGIVAFSIYRGGGSPSTPDEPAPVVTESDN